MEFDRAFNTAERDTAQLPVLVSAIIPCLDEEDAIALVVAGVRAHGIVDVIVVDGGSQDRTVERACAAGARIVIQPQRGYGRAIQAGIAAAQPQSNVLLFLDGDGSDRTERIPDLLAPIRDQRAAFVHGSRTRGDREPGSLSVPQIVAGQIAGALIQTFYGVRFTDMSPFRAIRREALNRLGMTATTYGWNLEMLMRVAASGLPAAEVAVGQRRRVGGVSKVSGRIGPSIRAAGMIGVTFVRLALALGRRRHT